MDKFMENNEMVSFVKAISDVNRLRIVGLLAQKSARLSGIADVLGLPPSDTRHHLDQLLKTGVVHLTGGLYNVDEEALEKLAREQLQGARQTYSPQADLENNRRLVLAAHLNPDGTIKTIPLQPAKLHILLDYLIDAFSVGATYTEKEVNLILAHFHPDTSGLRRDLIDAGMLERERDGSRYWRPK
jgi:ArsR family transcriptional regulator